MMLCEAEYNHLNLLFHLILLIEIPQNKNNDLLIALYSLQGNRRSNLPYQQQISKKR